MERQKDAIDFLASHWKGVLIVSIISLIIFLLLPVIIISIWYQNGYSKAWQNFSYWSVWAYTVIAFFTFVVIAITAFLAIQQLRASSYFQIYSRTDTALSLLLNDKVNLKKLYYSENEIKTLKDDDFHFADSTRLAVNMLFTLFENIYYQHEKFHVLDDEDWNSWKVSIKWLFSIPYVRECWQRKEAGSYTPEFVEEIKKLTDIQMASKVPTTTPSKFE